MNTDPQASPDRAETIFDGALQLPAEQRDAYVRQACGNDVPLRERVASLLNAHGAAGGFLEEPAAPARNPTIMLAIPVTEKPGDRIGRYKLLQQIGEGGCGVVYMAEQEEPVRRRVALKVIKLGMDTKSVIARFEAERQALALMDHPNIAKVLDAGGTDTGRPYFVMELVRGIRITDYCDQNKLSTAERLKLFTQVCHAIQHAHQKGIIHRDIKPSNILVTLHDGVPVPKVIDFGIAKATQGRLTDQTLFTAFEQFIGTPAYMSPEQAEMSGLDVDTRSDIYALGVLLYELLTGWTPFDPKELLKSGLDELRRMIREDEPARPSTRLSTMLDADLTAVAQRRQSEAPKLVHLLRGDLDWIVMKALEKDRTRRYETANGLALDIDRYMKNEPIVARPPSAMYRFQKLVRRNRAAVATIGTGFTVLVIGLAASLYLFAQERKARERADAAERIQARLAKEAEARRLQDAKWAGVGQRVGMGALFIMQGKFDEAERELGNVPLSVLTYSNFVATAPLFSLLGDRHARHGEWPLAITNYSKLIAIVPGDFPGYSHLISVFAFTKDMNAYQQLRERMRQRFGDSTDPVVAAGLAKDSLLYPAPPEMLDAIAKQMDRTFGAMSITQYWANLQFTRGLVEYRQGHFTRAAEWLSTAAEATDGDRYNYAESRLMYALAQYQLKQTAEAQAALREAVVYINTKLPQLGRDGLSEKWTDWISVNILMREALDTVPGAAGSAAELSAAPVWLAALTNAGYKVNCRMLDDQTWEVGLDEQASFSDLKLLSNVPISRLSIMRTKVSDLTPLKGMPLKMLRLAHTPVTDLGPLRGLPLESLQISGTAISDLAAIRDLQLHDLRMTDCTNLTDLRPLAGMASLESLILPPNAANYEFLRGLPKLVRLSFKYDAPTRGPDQKATEFWANYDKAAAEKKNASAAP
jgi:serine/threonine protein kinase